MSRGPLKTGYTWDTGRLSSSKKISVVVEEVDQRGKDQHSEKKTK